MSIFLFIFNNLHMIFPFVLCIFAEFLAGFLFLFLKQTRTLPFIVSFCLLYPFRPLFLPSYNPKIGKKSLYSSTVSAARLFWGGKGGPMKFPLVSFFETGFIGLNLL